MFRSGRWRSEKNKVKAEFKLQFHATQISEFNLEALTVSVVPGDAGKPTARSDKSVVREGTCRWQYPIHETVKFTRDARTGKVARRIYRFLVSSFGSSKSEYVGEVLIDFADYAEITKALIVSLPLKTSKCHGVLHISLQKLQNKEEAGQDGDTELPNSPINDSFVNSLTENHDHNDSIKKLPEMDELLDNGAPSIQTSGESKLSSGSDITLSSSESSSSLNTPRTTVGVTIANVLQDSSAFSSSHRLASGTPKQLNTTLPTNDREEHHQTKWGWLGDLDHGAITDDSSQSTVTGERVDEASDVDVEKLKAEIGVLVRQVDLSELELQALRKQIVKENKKVQDLSKELMCIKEERDVLQVECEKFKSCQSSFREVTSKRNHLFDGNDSRTIIEELTQELKYERDLNGNLRLQLQKTQDSNAELMLAVKDLEEMMDCTSRSVLGVSRRSLSCEYGFTRNEYDAKEHDGLNELVMKCKNDNGTCNLDQDIINLQSEIDMCRRDKDEIEMQMEQLALDYEILKQENHNLCQKLEQSQLEEQLKTQYECCSSSVKLNELETKVGSLESEIGEKSKACLEFVENIYKLQLRIKILEEENDVQREGFEADLEELMQLKVDQEQRAIKAEDDLRQTKWKNARAAEKLQGELKQVFLKMQSAFDENEKVAMNALTEVSLLREQKSHLEDMVKKNKEEFQCIKDAYEIKLGKVCNQICRKADEIKRKVTETDSLSRQFETRKSHDAHLVETLTDQVNQMKSEIEKLLMDNTILLERGETENMDFKEINSLGKPDSVGKVNFESLKEANKYSGKLKYSEVDDNTTETCSDDHKNLQLCCPNSDAISFENEQNGVSSVKQGTWVTCDSLKEISLLKERNNEMESELKEMQQRYSELSVKFAEVEGERQEVVMALRNLKGSKRR